MLVPRKAEGSGVRVLSKVSSSSQCREEAREFKC